ncbi:hypothetical protein [Streptacidiphilus sp. EB129]|uniref:hypothetical protein n=1 Tax=Streptacidiphilus sp. EB129 TaxID=3156262 RepID=UPI003513067D
MTPSTPAAAAARRPRPFLGHRSPTPRSRTHRSRSRRSASVLVLLAVAALTAGCSGGGSDVTAAAATTPPPACKPPAPAVLPHSAGTLDQTSTGAFCLPVGQSIDVFLTAPNTTAPQSDRWAEVASSDSAVLSPGNTGVLTAPLGVTPGVFVGAVPGTSVLSSHSPDGRAWQVTVVVR